MTKEQAIEKAKTIYNGLGIDPQATFAIIQIARFLMENTDKKAETDDK